MGLGIIGVVVLAIAGSAAVSTSGAPATWVSWLEIVLGVLLLLVSVRQFRGRPRCQESSQSQVNYCTSARQTASRQVSRPGTVPDPAGIRAG